MKSNYTQTDEINALYGKVPPQALEVEEAVLGALMLERNAYTTVSGIIDTASFYVEAHQIIFEIVKGLATKGKPVDLLTVTTDLKDKGHLESIGGPAFITQLTRRVASAAHIEAHARIIAEKHFAREMISRATEIINQACNGDDTETLSSQWRKNGDELENIFTVADSGSSLKNVLKSTISEIEKDCVSTRENKTPGIPTGLPSLNENTGGWRKGNLIILAARPGVGKTSVALHFAIEAAKAGYYVNFFSLEMTKEDLTKILLASESNVYRSDIRDGTLKPNDWEKINIGTSQLENLPIILKDASGMSVTQIQAAIRKNRKNRRCDFVIIDYLQLVKSSLPKAIRELEVSEVSRTLKTTALTENVPILTLSQLNRAADGETPKLSHLRESGAIEQDADMVCLLHRNDEKKNTIRLIVAKHRRGKLGDIDISANEEMTKFKENLIA
jgi:replicative DNA helicase